MTMPVPRRLLEALTRFSSNRTRTRGGAGKARIFTFLSAKGGAGATTAAVNTAVALQQAYGSVVLVDFAPIGNAQLHLNLRHPSFWSASMPSRTLHRLHECFVARRLHDHLQQRGDCQIFLLACSSR